MTSVGDLDPFTARRVPDVAQRWLALKDAHRRNADALLLGMVAATFTDDELGILRDLGYLSPHDVDLFTDGRRPPRRAHNIEGA